MLNENFGCFGTVSGMFSIVMCLWIIMLYVVYIVWDRCLYTFFMFLDSKDSSGHSDAGGNGPGSSGGSGTGDLCLSFFVFIRYIVCKLLFATKC